MLDKLITHEIVMLYLKGCVPVAINRMADHLDCTTKEAKSFIQQYLYHD
jgi:hypothetical protein